MQKENLTPTDMQLPSVDGGMVTVTDELINKLSQYKNVRPQINNINDDLIANIPMSNPMVEQQKITNKRIASLQESLDLAKVEIKQLNDKNASQNLYIKELKADLQEQSLQRELAETKVSAKDWKIALISGGIGLLVGLVCAYFSFWLVKI